MFKSSLKYLVIFIFSILIVSQFQNSLNQLKLIPKGIVKLLFPEKKTQPSTNQKEINDKIETINANSFELKVKKVSYFSGYNKDKDGKMNPQHKSAALYAVSDQNNTFLELYTRDGFLITQN